MEHSQVAIYTESNLRVRNVQYTIHGTVYLASQKKSHLIIGEKNMSIYLDRIDRQHTYF